MSLVTYFNDRFLLLFKKFFFIIILDKTLKEIFGKDFVIIQITLETKHDNEGKIQLQICIK